jgi:hypothetical protein
MALFTRLRSIDRDDWIWLDKMLRIIAVVVGVCALPLLFFVSVMAFDDPHPDSQRYAGHLTQTLLAIDILGVLLAFVPKPVPPISQWRLLGFFVLRVPPYAVCIVGVGGLLWLVARSLLR